ncbi:nucleic acid-binding protein [Streptomyces sp. NPDC004296]|uniref:nucleic acid-binding protein n=1 Tax=Streptomyces sp. NPDC004296 TaxID=3364697 RepID=UPI00369F84DF
MEELQGWSRAKETGGGYYESHRPDSPGWSDAEQQQVAELRARVLDLSQRVVTHAFWSSCENAPAARSALKHATAGDPDPA